MEVHNFYNSKTVDATVVYSERHLTNKTNIFLVDVISSPSNYSTQTMLSQQGLGAFLLRAIVRRSYD
jgi:hypothetical protein